MARCAWSNEACVGAGASSSRAPLGEGCVVGERCIIHPGAVIGADCSASRRTRAREKIEQPGPCASATTWRSVPTPASTAARFADTVIEDGVKLDNLIQIGHNVRSAATPPSPAAWGRRQRDHRRHCTIGGAAMILGHLTLADQEHLGRPACIASILKPGLYSGIPIDDNAAWEKNAATPRATARDRVKALKRRTNHDGHPRNPEEAVAPLPVPAGTGARDRAGQAHQGAEERHHQRPFSLGFRTGPSCRAC
jgi:UDP-3-O-[3-hydroxymyristoyl] glucosamine N-acyltransferase